MRQVSTGPTSTYSYAGGVGSRCLLACSIQLLRTKLAGGRKHHHGRPLLGGVLSLLPQRFHTTNSQPGQTQRRNKRRVELR